MAKKFDGFDHVAYVRRLRLLREAFGMNQVEFAKKLGVPFKRWSNWERGYPLPREAAWLLKDKFRVSVEWVWWGWDKHMPADILAKIKEAETHDKDRAAAERQLRKWQDKLNEMNETRRKALRSGARS